MYTISLEIIPFSIIIIIAIIIDKFNNMGKSFLTLQTRNVFKGDRSMPPGIWPSVWRAALKPPLPQPKWLVVEGTI